MELSRALAVGGSLVCRWAFGRGSWPLSGRGWIPTRFFHALTIHSPEVKVVRIFYWRKQWSLEFCETCLACLVVYKSGGSLLRSSRQLCTSVDPLILREHDLVCVK